MPPRAGLAPGHVGRVTRERDVGARRVDIGGGDRLAAVGDHEVTRRPADQAGDEDRVHASDLLVPGHPGRGGACRRSSFRRPPGDPRRPPPGCCSANSPPRWRPTRRKPELVGPEVSSVSCSELPTATQWKPPFAATAVVDPLGGEHHLVGVQSVQAGRPGLIPDHPWHRIVGAGEGDVRLDPVACRVDILARVGATGARPGDPGLLPAEAADRRNVAPDFDARRLDPVAIGAAGRSAGQ